MSAKPDEVQRLSHILEAIERIYRFTEDMDFQKFKENEMAQFAVIKNFEIIGEATYQLSSELKDKYRQVEWRKIAAFRHILVHEYYQIDMAIVWNAREDRLEELKNQIEAIIEKERAD
jgi:uncharacterized protein with HEPN domain